MSPFDLSWRNVVIVVVFFFPVSLWENWRSVRNDWAAEWFCIGIWEWGGQLLLSSYTGVGGGAEMPPLSTSDATIWAHKGHFSVLCVCPDGGKDTILPIVDKGSWCLVCLPPKATSRQTVPVSRGPFLLLPVFLTLKSQIISLRVGGSS